MTEESRFLCEAIELADANIAKGGRPFGAVVVRDGEVVYAYSNDDGALYGLSTAAIYADLAKPFAEQSMKIRHAPVRLEQHPDLYADWKRTHDKRA